MMFPVEGRLLAHRVGLRSRQHAASPDVLDRVPSRVGTVDKQGRQLQDRS